ncbi:hypothetical protein PM082_004484 [Marasmius tenuissimus]|nr:hypothetical protein PM082_004484 [Marasmius tenuissimus]
MGRKISTACFAIVSARTVHCAKDKVEKRMEQLGMGLSSLFQNMLFIFLPSRDAPGLVDERLGPHKHLQQAAVILGYVGSAHCRWGLAENAQSLAVHRSKLDTPKTVTTTTMPQAANPPYPGDCMILVFLKVTWWSDSIFKEQVPTPRPGSLNKAGTTGRSGPERVRTLESSTWTAASKFFTMNGMTRAKVLNINSNKNLKLRAGNSDFDNSKTARRNSANVR